MDGLLRINRTFCLGSGGRNPSDQVVGFVGICKKDEDKVALLEKYKRELREELNNIQAQLEELKRKT